MKRTLPKIARFRNMTLLNITCFHSASQGLKSRLSLKDECINELLVCYLIHNFVILMHFSLSNIFVLYQSSRGSDL